MTIQVQVNKSVYTPIHARIYRDLVFTLLYLSLALVASLLFIKDMSLSINLPFAFHVELLSSLFISLIVFIIFLFNVKVVTMLVLVSTPISLILFSSFAVSYSNYNPLAISSLVLIILSILLSSRFLNWKAVSQSITIIELAANILLRFPVLLLSTSIFLIPYILFTSTLIPIMTVILNPRDSFIPLHFQIPILTVFYLWTCQLLKYLLKSVVSTVVAQWYFDDESGYNFIDDEEVDVIPKDEFGQALLKSGHVQNTITFKKINECLVSCCTHSFGSIALASLLLVSLKLMKQVLVKVQKTTTASFSFTWPIFAPINLIFGMIFGSIVSLNEYTLTYMAISNKPFTSSIANTTKIFKRNLVQGITASSTIKIVFFAISVTIPTIFGIVMINLERDSIEIGIIWYCVALVGGFIGQVVEGVSDALFICYVVDLDQDLEGDFKVHLVYKDVLK